MSSGEMSVGFEVTLAPNAGEIVGGREAWPHSRPYMAYLEIQNGKNISQCGGFLVSENFVLTAAHCNGIKITVMLGAHNVNKILDMGRQKIPACAMIPHPQYKNTTDNNDIMLLKLKRNAKLTKTVGLIKLPTAPQRVLPQTMCSVAGWGMTSLYHTTNTLREVNLTVTTDQTCDSQYPNYNPTSMLCAGDPCDSKTFYLGDSGGPLVCGGVAEDIVSHCIANSIAPPGVYTRVSPFMRWINDTMTHS